MTFPSFNRLGTGLAALLTIVLGILLLASLQDIPLDARGLSSLVEMHMDESGVQHPVTAVLLNFRGYDTWLEIGVLYLAILGVLTFQRRSDLRDIVPLPAAEPVLNWLIRLLVPLMVLTSGYLLWMGKFSAGGAFQAGVVLGAAGVLLWLAGYTSVASITAWRFRFLLAFGFLIFLIIAAATVLAGQALLQYPVPYAGDLILLIETAATISIGWIVAALIIGLQPSERHRPRHETRRDQPL